MTIDIINNRSNMNILMNMNTFNSNNFGLLSSIYNFVLTFIILKLDCTYLTLDHAASRDDISPHLNLIKVQI